MSSPRRRRLTRIVSSSSEVEELPVGRQQEGSCSALHESQTSLEPGLVQKRKAKSRGKETTVDDGRPPSSCNISKAKTREKDLIEMNSSELLSRSLAGSRSMNHSDRFPGRETSPLDASLSDGSHQSK